MNRLDRSTRSLKDMPRAGAFAAAAGVAILAGTATWTAALAEQPDANLRYEAPIGHRQPRIKDLPSDVAKEEAQEEKKTQAEEDALDKKLETSICRGC